MERYHGPDELVQAETPPSIVGAGCMSFWFLQILRQPQGWDSTFCLDTVTGAPLGIPGVIYMVFRGSGRVHYVLLSM